MKRNLVYGHADVCGAWNRPDNRMSGRPDRGRIKPFYHVLKPVLGIIQVVPPISWLILAMIWFGYNGKASVFIVVMAVAPSMFICISDGIGGADRKLLKMGDVFGFPFFKKLRYIYLPSAAPYFFRP